VHFLCRHILHFTVFFAVFALLVPLVSCALDAGYRGVKAGELKKLMDTSLPVLIVDNRSEYEYNRGHLPKAINIPQERLFSLDNLLPKDKGLPIVFYCTGSG
jgi:rhodanese-related sulfurtransferase